MGSMLMVHAGVVASVVIMLFCISEGVPQTFTTMSGIPEDDDEFIDLLLPAAPCHGQPNCLLFEECCDPLKHDDQQPTNNPYNSFTEYRIIDIVEHEKDKCDDILCIYCDIKCDQNTTTPPPPPVNPPNQYKCGYSNSNGVGFKVKGTEFEKGQAQFGEFPWMVAVLGHNNLFIGGGALVAPRVILTAGHKVHNLSDNLVARIDDWDITSNSEHISHQDISVEKKVFHPNFQRRTLENNIALLILQKDAILGETVMPICLPQSGQVFNDANCTVTGWGKDVFGKTGRYQAIMKKISLPAVNHSKCQSMLRKTDSDLGSNFTLHSSFNCAGGLGERTCEGDGGSPLVCPSPENPDIYVQVGVVSWGIGCGVIGNPTVFASVTQTVKWINRTINEEGGRDLKTFEFRTKVEE